MRGVTLTKILRAYFLNYTLVVFISARNIFCNFWDKKEKELRIECYIDKSRIFCSIHNSQNNFLLSTILYFVVEMFSEWNHFFDNYFYLRQIWNLSCRGFMCIFERCIHVNWKLLPNGRLSIWSVSWGFHIQNFYKNLLIS